LAGAWLLLTAGCGNVVKVVRSRVVTTYVYNGIAIPTVSAGADGGGQVMVRVWPMGIESRIKAVVNAYAVALVANQPGDGGQNPEGVPAFNREVGKGRNEYSTVPTIAAYRMPAASETLMVLFTDVAPGTYRVRVQALDRSGANVSWPLPAMGPIGTEQCAVSMNAASVVSPTITFYRNTTPNGGSDVRLDSPIQALTTDKE
jgi:hypothetical protein